MVVSLPRLDGRTSVGGPPMSNQKLDLARRAVACVSAGHWPEGSRLLSPQGQYCRIWSTSDDKVQIEAGSASSWYRKDDLGDFLPDLDGPATLGCLLHLVREETGDPDLHVVMAPETHNQNRPLWVVVGGDGSPLMAGLRFTSKIEAMVAALESVDE